MLNKIAVVNLISFFESEKARNRVNKEFYKFENFFDFPVYMSHSLRIVLCTVGNRSEFSNDKQIPQLSNWSQPRHWKRKNYCISKVLRADLE